MRANFIHIEQLLRKALREAGGDVAEFGVWHGTTFLPMAELSRMDGRTVHAVDSFVGMAQATERDAGRYQKGDLSVGGSANFRALVRPFKNVRTHGGFIPDVLDELASFSYCFAHVDLDQYEPTLHVLRHVWPRLASGGIVACHDWFKGRRELAAGAIADWMTESGVETSGEQPETQHVWFIKP